MSTEITHTQQRAAFLTAARLVYLGVLPLPDAGDYADFDLTVQVIADLLARVAVADSGELDPLDETTVLLSYNGGEQTDE